jgi:hypothetical protein
MGKMESASNIELQKQSELERARFDLEEVERVRSE